MTFRSRLRAEDGFTLVEMLVVVLIIGVLASLGLATFLNQRAKAQDSEAKTAVTAAATALVVYEGDNGTFGGADQSDLAKIEPSLGQANALQVDGTPKTFEVSVESKAGGSYTIERDADGKVRRSCSRAGEGSCSEDHSW